MTHMAANRYCAFALLFFCLCINVAHAAIERIEPPNWWVGMKNNRLQLMVHGDAIGEYTPSIKHAGVKLTAARKAENNNYLFVDLTISPGMQPGPMEIVFTRGAEKLRHTYQLRAREKGSADRVGFNSSDVILNLMPDRFANGDPANDRVPGFLDKLDRSDDSAGRHGGDIKGIVDHLDYIAAMGYTQIWPTPVVENNQAAYSYHGYGATDTYKIDARFGSNDDYRRMVAEARKKGIGVIQDIVINHIGGNHWWMRDMPSKDWLSFDGKFNITYHARTTASDPYASEVDRKNFTDGWFEESMPDMNQRNPLLATYQIQNALWWIEYAGLSGVRADTYGYSNQQFLAGWSKRIMAEYPKLNIVGEEWSDIPLVVSYWQRGKKNPNGYVSHLPSLMDFPLFYRLRRGLTEADTPQTGLVTLYEGLVSDMLYPAPNNLVLFEGNHDVARIYSALNEDLGLYKMAIAYVLTMRGIPQMYYGSEILMTSPKERDDGAVRKDFPGGWAGDMVNAFTGAGLSAQQKEAQAFVKKLANWRKSQSVIHRGKLMHYAPDNGTYAYFRYDEKQKIMVVLNKNKSDVVLDVTRFREMLAKHSSAVDVISGKKFDLTKTLTVPARSVVVLDVR